MEATSSSTDDRGLILKGSKKAIHFNIELQDHWQMDESHVCGLSDCEFQPTNHGVRLDHPNRIENRNTFRYNYQKKLRKQFASIPRGWIFVWRSWSKKPSDSLLLMQDSSTAQLMQAMGGCTFSFASLRIQWVMLTKWPSQIVVTMSFLRCFFTGGFITMTNFVWEPLCPCSQVVVISYTRHFNIS